MRKMRADCGEISPRKRKRVPEVSTNRPGTGCLPVADELAGLSAAPVANGWSVMSSRMRAAGLSRLAA